MRALPLVLAIAAAWAALPAAAQVYEDPVSPTQPPTQPSTPPSSPPSTAPAPGAPGQPQPVGEFMGLGVGMWAVLVLMVGAIVAVVAWAATRPRRGPY